MVSCAEKAAETAPNRSFSQTSHAQVFLGSAEPHAYIIGYEIAHDRTVGRVIFAPTATFQREGILGSGDIANGTS